MNTEKKRPIPTTDGVFTLVWLHQLDKRTARTDAIAYTLRQDSGDVVDGGRGWDWGRHVCRLRRSRVLVRVLVRFMKIEACDRE